jgi:galactose mutarotase-like enzyme
MGAYRIPWSWCAHPLFAVDSGDRIILPGEVKTVQIEGSDATRLGGNSDVISWPIAKTASGEETDLSIAAEADSGIGDKLFAGPLHENWCVLERKKLGLRLTVRFEPSLTPYLGLWLCYGGWPDAPGPKQVCVALEPATTPVDSLAKLGAWSRWLDPGDTCTWPMELQIERNANAT